MMLRRRMSVAGALSIAFVVAALTAFAPFAFAAGSMMDLKSGKETIQAYLSMPEGGGKGAPGIVVVHEWWGLNDWPKRVADRLAAQGYVAIVPDLYRGKVATDP